MNAALFGLIAAFAWGAHDFAARFVVVRIGGVGAVLGVTIAGALLLSAWILIGDLRVPWRPESLWLPALSGVGLVVATVSLFVALGIGPVSVVTPIAASYPSLAVAIAIVLGARPNALAWVGMGAVIVGVIPVARGGETALPKGVQPEGARLAARSRAKALICAFAASLGFAASLTAGQYATRSFGEIEASWIARLFGLAAILIVFLRPSQPKSLPIRWLPYLFVMGALDTTAFGLILTAGGAPNSEMATVASAGFGAVAALLARVFLKERVSFPQWGGIALIAIGTGILAKLG